MGSVEQFIVIVKHYNTLNTLAFYIIVFTISLKMNYSVTGQIEDQQINHQHCPPRVLVFEIGQPIINVKRFSRFSPNSYVMKHCGAILYQLYLHVGFYRTLRKE